MSNPALTAQQRRVVNTSGVRLLGIDAKGRPVVEMLAGIPNRMQRWSLTKAGEAADVVEPVAPIE